MNKIDRWLTESGAEAAQSLGLFRILYGVFYLWFTLTKGNNLWEIPSGEWNPILLLRWLPSPPDKLLIQMLIFTLVLSLALLVIGYRTRISTIGVLIAGMGLAALRYSFIGTPHSDHFMEIYIPAIMIFSTWGDTYSIDSLKGHVSNHSSSSWHHVWPQKVVLLLLALLFLLSAYVKVMMGNFLQPNNFKYLLIQESVSRTIYGYPNFNFATLLASNEFAHRFFQIFAVLFEAFFWLSLLGPVWRAAFLTMAIGFHCFNALVIPIDFSPMLLSYALFVNWHRWKHVFFAFLSIPIVLGIARLVVFPSAKLHRLAQIEFWYMIIPILMIWFIYSSIEEFKRNLKYQGIREHLALPEQ